MFMASVCDGEDSIINAVNDATKNNEITSVSG
jgi:hypothetical protein